MQSLMKKLRQKGYFPTKVEEIQNKTREVDLDKLVKKVYTKHKPPQNSKRVKHITEVEYQSILNRLDALENRTN